MPSFFNFQQGSRENYATDSSPLLGRFRAVPDAQRIGRRNSQRNSLFGSFAASRRFGYASVFGGGDDSDEGDLLENEDIGALRRFTRTQRDLWLEPKQAAVGKLVDKWWSRWAVLVILPAALAVGWCALPFPQYDLPGDDGMLLKLGEGHKIPGHGASRVELNFWFFLFVYYGFYNITALMWITKVFNIYSLNWSVPQSLMLCALIDVKRWPESFGFPLTVSIIAVISIATPIPIYCVHETLWITSHNTAWICWTFFTMAMPLIVASVMLLYHERHLSLRTSLSETQRIFTSSWWTGDSETVVGRDRPRRANVQQAAFDPNAPLEVALATDNVHRTRAQALALRKRWLPASFVRFIWFCSALFIGMLAYVVGEAYAETYLRTLPHSTMQTIVYVYTWVITVHLLDGLTGWILGGNDGERVGSYPLGWIFKLFVPLNHLHCPIS
jgi:hypothetical protein